VVQGRKKKYSDAAEQASLYGIDILNWGVERPNYETYCGLWANRDRTMVRMAIPVSIGAGLAMGGGSPSIFRAMADTPAEANYMIGQWEAAQAARR
jgi:hypothetical protein